MEDSITIEERIVGSAEVKSTAEVPQSTELTEAKIDISDPYIDQEMEDVSPTVEKVDAESHAEEDLPVEPVDAAAKEELPKSVQKRINKYVREKREADERAARAEQQGLAYLQQLQQFQGGVQQAPSRDPYAPMEPLDNDPKYIGNEKAYLRDYIKYEKDKIVYESQRNNAQRYQNDLETRYAQRIEEAREKYDDFDETIASLNSYPAINNHANAQQVISMIREIDNGADVAYYLAKNRGEFIDILNSNSVRALIELGKRSALLESPKIQNIKPTSPAPPKNVGNSGKAPQAKRHFADLSIDEMEKHFRSIR